ncbi:hypothetical protein TIFTF001_029090 [Ficus carica]|uniref:Uncharacterized protein n=1 Tax=Ficus carica TaxID=3494 RepID=A0AA88DV63_FICCA|nr:hypothetical protein TIFTF001_029090 [Ficus carica]
MRSSPNPLRLGIGPHDPVGLSLRGTTHAQPRLCMHAKLCTLAPVLRSASRQMPAGLASSHHWLTR